MAIVVYFSQLHSHILTCWPYSYSSLQCIITLYLVHDACGMNTCYLLPVLHLCKYGGLLKLKGQFYCGYLKL